MQDPDYCLLAAYHFTEPCRSMEGDTDTSLTTLLASIWGAARETCAGEDAAAALQVRGSLTAPAVTLPAAGFQCSCVCDNNFPTWLGSISLLLRAVDVATDDRPNYKNLRPECSAPDLEPDGQVFVTGCRALLDTSLSVRAAHSELMAVVACLGGARCCQAAVGSF